MCRPSKARTHLRLSEYIKALVSLETQARAEKGQFSKELWRTFRAVAATGLVIYAGMTRLDRLNEQGLDSLEEDEDCDPDDLKEEEDALVENGPLVPVRKGH